MKINQPKRLRQEDFPEEKFMARLSSIYNALLDLVVSALNKGLTFNDNFDGIVKEVLTDGEYPITVAWPRTSKPVAVWVGKVRRADGADAALSNAVCLDWRVSDSGAIQIDNILGITASASTKYYVTIIGVTG